MLNKAVIDLGKLYENAKAVRSLLKGAKFNAVVKADAYGHGAEIVANTLYSLVDSYSVAIPEEGIKLRLSGIDKDILCFTPLDYLDAPRAISLNLISTVTNVEQIKMLSEVAKNQGRKAKVHIKYNSGMNRQGVDNIEQLKEIVQLIKRETFIELDGIYSHFAFPSNKKSLKSALNKFLLANNFVKGYNNKATGHISASGGLLQGVTLDMVRVGIMLYGYTPFSTEKINVQPVMKVYSPIICKRELIKGDTALYSDKKVGENVNVSLIRYGYADGLERREVFGQFNNRCMDVTAVTEEKPLTEYGYPVMENADITAKKYKTISYEILTKSAIRAEKIYLR